MAGRQRRSRRPAGAVRLGVRRESSATRPPGRAPDRAFEAMILGARNTATLGNYRNPYLKLTTWIALHGGAVAPPDLDVVGRYLVYVVALQRNKSVAEQAVRALQFVCWSNGCPSISGSPQCRIPMEAAGRPFSSPVVKAAPGEPWMVVAVVRGAAAGPEPQRMMAWAVKLNTGFQKTPELEV